MKTDIKELIRIIKIRGALYKLQLKVILNGNTIWSDCSYYPINVESIQVIDTTKNAFLFEEMKQLGLVGSSAQTRYYHTLDAARNRKDWLAHFLSEDGQTIVE